MFTMFTTPTNPNNNADLGVNTNPNFTWLKRSQIEISCSHPDESLTEDQLQAKVFKWAWNSFPSLRQHLFAIPNGGLRNKREAAKLKATGVVAGIADLEFIFGAFVCFFELKVDNNKLSDKQKSFRRKMIVHGVPVYEIRSTEQFQRIFIHIIMNQIEHKIKNTEAIEKVQFFGLTREQFEYESNVFQFLFKMKCGSEYKLAVICEEATQQQFVDCVKKFILFEFDVANGFYIEFKSDWTAFRKVAWPEIATNTDINPKTVGRNE